MGILRAIGFILFLVALKVLMPEVFKGLEDTLIALFITLKKVLVVAGTFQGAQAGLTIPNMVPRLPR